MTAHSDHPDPEITPAFLRWRLTHRVASATLVIMAVIHSAVTPLVYSVWSPGAVWFLGTGLGLLLLGTLNLVHIGIGPCRMPTTPFVRISNWAFLAFGIGAAIAVPEPQAYLIVAALAVQATAARQTLPGVA